MNLTPTELRLQSRSEQREIARAKADEIVGMDEIPDTESKHLALLREEMESLDSEITELLKDKESDDEAKERAKLVRRAMLHETGTDGDGPIYREFSEYALDYILTRQTPICSKIAAQFGDKASIEAAHARLDLLKRTPADTLSANVAGLSPAQHISQIFQVIDASRPLVAAAPSTGLVRGSLTYPRIDTRPVVAVQGTEKTEAGNTGLAVSMQTATASTYLGGGDLSWQAINWSTPDALGLWFNIAAADYALKTETDATNVVIDDAFVNIISSPLSGTPTFADFMTAVGAGYAKVFTQSKRIANTIVLAPDRFGYVLGMTSAAFAQFTTVSGSQIGPLNVIVSRGMDAGTILVGDIAGLLVAETPGAPVELRVVEPAIGGVEVGLIGAFEAVIVDAGSFSLITTAS